MIERMGFPEPKEDEDLKNTMLFVFSILFSDFDLISEVLMKNERIKKMMHFLTCLYHLINMTMKEFGEGLQNNEETYMNYTNELAEIISELSVSALKERLSQIENEAGYEMEAKDKRTMLGFLEKGELLQQLIILLHSNKYKSLKKSFVFPSILKILHILKESLDEEKQKKFNLILVGLSGIDEIDDVAELIKRDRPILLWNQKFNIMFKAILAIYYPSLEKLYPLIQRVLNLIFSFSELAQIREETELLPMLSHITNELGLVLDVNTQQIQGIIGIIHGDFNALVKLAAPICKIDEAVIHYSNLQIYRE
jgi:hypothetical protein